MFVPIRKLAQLGVISDPPAFDIPPNAFTDGFNVVFRHGKVEKCPGWDVSKLSPAPTEDLYWFQSWEASSQVLTAFFGAGKIWIWDGSSFDPATTPALNVRQTWTSEVFGEFVIGTNSVDKPIYSSGTGITWAELPGYGTGGALDASCRAIRSYKSYLFAISMPGNPYTIAWSDIGKLGAMPSNWDIADPASFAGTLDIQASDGEIVDAAQLGDSLIVYTQFACYAITATGNIRNPMTSRRLFRWGISSIEAVKPYENMHFCIANDIIYIHDGSRIERIADNRVEEKFFQEVGNTRSVKVAVVPSEHEIIVYYKRTPVADPNDDPAPPADRIMRWNWREDSFSFEDPETSLWCIRQSSVPGVITTWADLATDPGNADDGSTSWDDLSNNGVTWRELNGRGDSLKPYQLDQKIDNDQTPPVVLGTPNWSEREFGLTRAGVPYNGYVERLYADMDEVSSTNEFLMELRQVYPQVTGNGSDVYFQFGSAASPGGTIIWEQPVPWSFGVDQYKVDTRISNRYLCWRIGTWPAALSPPGGGSWTLSGMDLDIYQDGRR